MKLAREGSPRAQQVANLVMAQLIKKSAAPYRQVPALRHQFDYSDTCGTAVFWPARLASVHADIPIQSVPMLTSIVAWCWIFPHTDLLLIVFVTRDSSG